MRSIGLPELLVIYGLLFLALPVVVIWLAVKSRSRLTLASRTCPHCGQRIPDLGSYCTLCGQKTV